MFRNHGRPQDNHSGHSVARGALLAAPLIWLALGAGLVLSHRLLNWPSKEGGNTVLLLAVGVSLVPTLLAVLDYVASSRAAMDIKGIKIDFSQGELKRGHNLSNDHPTSHKPEWPRQTPLQWKSRTFSTAFSARPT